MIKSFKNPENLKVNVFLKNGKSFLDKDITLKPLGEYERIISFWDDGAVKCIPIERVSCFEFYEKKN